ncbi:hypothetical protein GE061_002903 [Apolygus lucorum]|uniref:Thioredoxin-like fold domain-containing protein n=1 Tax=Apolygus lucorum TaxID=248454 RepID=A0A6A4JHZ8_APOLU|nr:hypothetical protein GE061_002903 [Apolygus lucorum]
MGTSKINWVDNLLVGLAEAEAVEKIALLFVHRSDCAICFDILDELNKSEDVCQESSRFVMIKITEDVLPPEYDIDGKYTPKILFLDPNGVILERYWNTKLNFTEAKFYYCSADQLLVQMKNAYIEQMSPRRHKCSPSACSASWRRSLTPAACAFALMAVVPAMMLLFFPNELVT